jgi:PAS domain-containing protein
MSPDWKEMFYLRGGDFILDSNEPTGTWLQKYIPRDDQQFVTAAIDEAIRNKSIFELEHRVLREDGSLGWTFSRAIPIRNAEGEVVEWFGAASDITERKRAEEALRRSEARWNAAIENLGAAVVIATDTEQVIYRNPAARAMHGFTSDQGVRSLARHDEDFPVVDAGWPAPAVGRVAVAPDQARRNFESSRASAAPARPRVGEDHFLFGRHGGERHR